MRSVFWLLPITALVSLGASHLRADAVVGYVGIPSVTVSLTGTKTLRVTSGPSGYYAFHTLTPGNYVVTPTLSGYTFSPSSQSVTIGSQAGVVSASFTVTKVPTETGLAAAPASVSLQAAGAIEQLLVEATYSNESSLDVTGNATYASNSTSVATVSQEGLITAVGKGSATIIASYGGMASSVGVTVTSTGVTYSISGTTGAASARVTLSGAASSTATAAANGTYSFSGLAPGSYAITPSLAGYTFTPESRSTAITNANVSGVNFTATATAHSVDLSWGAGAIQNPAAGQVVLGYNVYRSTVSGGPYTKLNSSPTPGLTYVDSSVSAGQTLYYVCSTVDNLGDVSRYSNQATATVP